MAAQQGSQSHQSGSRLPGARFSGRNLQSDRRYNENDNNS